MKRTLFLVLLIIPFLIPFTIYGQITVVDGDGYGPGIDGDIDTQSSTTLYQGTFFFPETTWIVDEIDYRGDEYQKYYYYELISDSTGNPLYGNTYPLMDPVNGWSTNIPAVPHTVDIYAAAFHPETGYSQLNPGERFFLTVQAIARGEDDEFYSISDMIASNGVLILGGDTPPDDPDDTPDLSQNENALAVSGQISLSATPSSLLFADGDDSKSLQMRISTSGTGMISIDSIREDRIYPLWGEDHGFPESIDLDLPAGSSESVNLQITMSNLERAKALGSGTEGSFTLRYLVSGQDAWGNPVSATLNIPVTVSGSKSATLDVYDVSIQLPDSPYFLGETVIGSTISIEANGSGTIVGQVYVDDSLDWSLNPTFTISVSGTTAFQMEGQLPTDTEGPHTVRVELISPSGISAQESYQVSASESPFPTQPQQTLTLIPNVAELQNLSGSAAVVNIDGDESYTQYTFTGTALLRILSMDNRELQDAEVTNLIVRYESNNPGVPIITGGTVIKEGYGQTLTTVAGDYMTVAGGYLKIKQVEYAYDDTDNIGRLTARTNLNIPLLMSDDYLTLDNLGITEDGLELQSFSWDKNNPKSFTAFGVNFRLHDDVGGAQALTILEDTSADRYGFSMSGSIAWREQIDNEEVQEKEIVSFSELTFYTDGDFEGSINVSDESFDLIPGYLTITSAGLALEDDEMSFRLGGDIKKLPYPFDDENFNTTFSLAFDTAGNLSGDIVPIDELTGGERGLGGDDSSEWDAGVATVDLTYLGLEIIIIDGVLKREHSKIQIGADIYLDLLSDNDSNSGQDGSRIGFGTVGVDDNGQKTLTDDSGMEITFNGDVSWPSIEFSTSLLSNKSLDLGAVKASLDNLAFDCDSGNFAFLFSGSFNLDIEAIEGGISFTGLKVALSGDISGPDEIDGTDLRIMDFVSVRVGAVNWGSDTTISINEDKTSGEGTARQPAIEENVEISVDSYFEICTAAINIGSEDSSLMSGEFEQLLYYRIAGEDEPSFILKGAAVNVSGCELTADIKYDRTYLRVAGGIKMQQITGAVVGKIGYIPDGEPNAGEPTFGLFVMAEGLNAMVAPSVFLDGVGGGVFINPTNEDIDTVLAVSGFDKLELDVDGEIAEMRPQATPGGFAVMLFAGVYVAEKSLVEGQAMVTLTANYFELDAKVEALEGMLEGRSQFTISWNPLYAEGVNELEANLFDIFSINGDLSFYAYADDAWAIMGDVQVSMMKNEMASGGFFIGPPGFMVEATVQSGINIGLVSGYIQFSGMVWYYVDAAPDTWGAWADVEVGGSLLWGLVSAKAGIEGALIGQGRSVLIYSVGRVSFKVCGIKVYSGSIWVSIGGNPAFDGGKGRNDYYDALIDEARNMADAMETAKEELEDALVEAKDQLYQLTDAQRQVAGLALVERSGWVGSVLEISFVAAEIENWPDGLPRELQEIRDLLFGEEAQDLVQLRTELTQIRQDLNDAIEELDELQNQVLKRLDEYEQIVIEDLPNIRDLTSSGNPFQGIETASVQVGTEPRTVQVGFVINKDKVKQQKDELGGMRSDFGDYQNTFIQRADLLDTKLHRLDEILFESEQSFSTLMESYDSINSGLVDYMKRFIEFQQVNAEQARENLVDVLDIEVLDDNYRPTQEATPRAVRDLMKRTAAELSDTQLNNWNNLRIALINLLIDSQGGEPYLEEANIPDPKELFEHSGMELWWRLPNSGWDLSIELSDDRIAAAIDSFNEKGAAFRDSWENVTGISDTIFDRKADLYTLLYEIYDQLSVYGTGSVAAVSNAAPRSIDLGILNDTGRKPVDKGVPVTTYFENKRDEINPYLQFPEITEMNGQLYNNNGYSAFFNGNFAASHPVDIVEYAMRICPRGSYDPWRSLGTDQKIFDAYFPEYDIPGSYYFDLRARGAGGLTIEREGGFDLEFFNPEEDAGPFISDIDISDDSPPTKPVVSLSDSQTSNAQELYARWAASDYQSGIQRYEYAVGTYSAPEEPESDNNDFYLPGFGSVLEPVPGVSETTVFIPDVVPWTDAGGRTEVIIKNLDLQHGYEYVVNVRATNGTGLKSTGSSEPVLVDLTSPEGLQITEFIQQTVDEHPNSVKFEFTRAEEKETEVLAHYFALGSSPAADDIYPWTRTSFNLSRIANVAVPEGKTIYLSIKAVNSVGLERVVSSELEFRYNDSSAPEVPMVATNPQRSSSDYPWIVIGWNGVDDPESGIVSFSYGLSSTRITSSDGESLAKPDILGWVEVDLSEGPYLVTPNIGSGAYSMTWDENEEPQTTSSGGQAGNIGGATIAQIVDPDLLGTEYEVHRADIYLSGLVYAVVRVTNGEGLSSISYSIPIIYDKTPPEYAEVSAEQQQFSDDILVCQLNAGDQESGIEAYGYSITRIQDGFNLPWVSNRWVNVDSPLTGDLTIPIKIREFPSPGLAYGGEYKLSFRVRNRSGLSLSAGSVVIKLVAPDSSNDIKPTGVRRLQ